MIPEDKIPRLIALGQRLILRNKLSVTLEILKSDKHLFEEGIASGELQPEVKTIWKRRLTLVNFYLEKLDIPLSPYRSLSFKSQGRLGDGRTDQLVFEVPEVLEDETDDLEIHIEI